MSLARPAPAADPPTARVVRELLRRAAYPREGIQTALGVSGDVLARPQDRPVYLRRLRRDGALETLLRLFLLDQPVDAGVVERALAPTPLASLDALNLIAESGGQVRGTVRIVPHGDIVLAADLPERDDVHADHVAGLHRPSITLADLTIRRPVARALDVGTGFGIQAILASRHAEHVVATDVNERALAFAELNAVMNGVRNIELRLGSFFEPVAGETFGLVVCNPPYVISPETAYLFRDSGLGRDRVSEQLVGELPSFLDEGGFATIMSSWVLDGDEPAARPRDWLAGNGCDAWILHTAVEDPLAAAAAWNRDLANDEAGYAAAIDRWLAYFRDEGIAAVAYGAIVLRRRSDGPNWIQSRELPHEAREAPEDHLLRLFTGPDLSARLHDEASLAQARFTLADGAVITTRLELGPDGWTETAQLALERGIPFTAGLDRFTVDFLAGLDGRRTLGDVLDAVAAAHDVAPERVRASGHAIARTMLENGFATAVPPDGTAAGR